MSVRSLPIAALATLAFMAACQNQDSLTAPRLAPRTSSRSVATAVCAAVPAGLVSWWRGEGATADVLGTNTGQAVGSLAYAPGMVGQGFSLDGGSYMFVPNSPTMPAGAAPRTWTFWMYTSASQWPGDHHTPFHSGGQEFQRAFSLDFDSYPQLQFYTWGYDVSFDAGAPADGWMHVAMTYDGAQANIYINGQLRGALSGVLNTDASFGAKFGAFPEFIGGAAFFTGLMDEAALFNRALTAVEVQSIHDAGSAGMCVPPVTPAEFVAAALTTVTSLLASGDIDAALASSLTTTLNSVLAGIQAGAPTTSLNGKLGAADNKVNAAVNSRKITSATAAKLHTAIAAIRGSL